MTDRIYLRVREMPFLSGGRKLVVDGKTYYFRYHGYDSLGDAERRWFEN